MRDLYLKCVDIGDMVFAAYHFVCRELLSAPGIVAHISLNDFLMHCMIVK